MELSKKERDLILRLDTKGPDEPSVCNIVQNKSGEEYVSTLSWKKNGAFVPGIRQGKPTQDFLETTMNRITLLGAVSLALIAILPTIVGRLMNIDPSIAYFFGGTPILILVGVVLDTLQQIDSHLLTKRYDGLVSKGRVRGR